MRVWRLAKAAYATSAAQMLSGDGAFAFGGRWTPAGMRAVYCAETASLAVLEVLVHLADPSDFGAHKILDLDVPADLLVQPAGSSDEPQQVGREVLASSLGLMVASAVNSLERTVVLNPLHAAFGQIKVGRMMPFVLDGRLRRIR